MTNERAIEILDPEHREHYESIEPVNEACRIGIAAIKRVKVLESENAALRERLERAVELPVKIGDRVFCIVGLIPAVEEFEIIEITTKSKNPLYTFFEFQGIDVGYKTGGYLSGYGKRWFTELETVEARLKELQGE